MSSIVVPELEELVPSKRQTNPKPMRQPRYHVLLWDDDEHTFAYVIKMVRELFGHSLEKAREIAKTVDKTGTAVCLTTTREHAELKRDQIKSYGRDEGNDACRGSMRCSIEPEN